MSIPCKLRVCWIISDGRVGNDKQSQALAHYLQKQLSLKLRTFQVALKQPWRALSPRFRLLSKWAMPEELLEALDLETPDLLIACGRQAALVSCFIKRHSKGKTQTIQILNPYIDAKHFDVLVSPLHDRLETSNKVSTLGSLHKIDEDSLGLARQVWQGDLEKLERPRIAILIGGSNKTYQIDKDYILKMKECVNEVRRQYAAHHNIPDVPLGHLMISTSRRTSQALKDCVDKVFEGERVFNVAKCTENPYEGVLAWADAIVVSAESVNMISESLGTGKPVFSSPPVFDQSKFSHFHQSLLDEGSLLAFDAAQSVRIFEHSYKVMQEAERAAGEIIKMLGVNDCDS